MTTKFLSSPVSLWRAWWPVHRLSVLVRRKGRGGASALHAAPKDVEKQPATEFRVLQDNADRFQHNKDLTERRIKLYRGGPSRGFGFCYRLWTSFWGAESFGRRQVACFLGVGLRARAPQVGRTGWLAGWLIGWQVGLIGCGRSVGRSVDGLAAWLVGRLRLACWLKAWFLGAASRVFEA